MLSHAWRAAAAAARAGRTSRPHPSAQASYFTWQEEKGDDVLEVSPEDTFRAGVRHHHICNTAFPIAHTKTTMPYRVRRLRDQSEIKNVLYGAYGDLKEMMLYAHVPFCQTRCQFCEYTVVDPKVGRTKDAQDVYFDAMIDEMAMYDNLIGSHKKKLIGFDIGGGTPSMATTAQIERLMEAAKKHFNLVVSDMEVSIETTPKIAASEPEKIQAYYDMGIRRISMGLQTTDFKQAQEVGRDDANGIDYVYQAVANIRRAGFESFNIDLMYGFPVRKGREDPWEQTVRDCIGLAPEHITLYRMRYKGTSMAHLMNRVGLDQVNEQEKTARTVLAEHGYRGMLGKNTYSTVNSGCSDYLDKRVVQAVPYIGVGLGAQSFSHHTLQYNLGAVTKKLEQYVRSVELGRLPVQDLYHLSKRAAMGKMASVSFYYGGICLKSFKRIFGMGVEEAFQKEVQFVMEHGLMEYQLEEGQGAFGGVRVGDRLLGDTGRLQLTELGKKHVGGVISLFYSPSVKQHITTLKGGEESYQLDLDAMRRDASKGTPDDVNMKEEEEVNSTPEKEKFEFGNILFGGACNQKCPFCIGNELPASLTPANLREWPLKSLDAFIQRLVDSGTKKVICTGTRTDPQLYKHEKQLIEYLRKNIPDVHVSLHTNGLLAGRKQTTFSLYDSVTVSLNSFEPATYKLLHGVREIPDLNEIMSITKAPVKLSCIVTQDNYSQVSDYIRTASSLGIKRIAFRYVYRNEKRWGLFDGHTPVREHCGNPVYQIDNVEVTHWTFEDYSKSSLNLFSDGTISPHYLLSDAPQPSDSATYTSATDDRKQTDLTSASKTASPIDLEQSHFTSSAQASNSSQPQV